MEESECSKCQTFHHDLHTEVGHVPAAVIHDVVKQQTKVRIDLVSAFKFFVEITSEYFNVTCLVDYLSARIQLCVVPGHCFHNL